MVLVTCPTVHVCVFFFTERKSSVVSVFDVSLEQSKSCAAFHKCIFPSLKIKKTQSTLWLYWQVIAVSFSKTKMFHTLTKLPTMTLVGLASFCFCLFLTGCRATFSLYHSSIVLKWWQDIQFHYYWSSSEMLGTHHLWHVVKWSLVTVKHFGVVG